MIRANPLRTRAFRLRSAAFIAAAILAVSCRFQPDYERLPQEENPGSGLPTEGCFGSCHADKFKQDDLEDEAIKKLDLIFVTDTSGSLDEEREEIAGGIIGFIGQMPKDIHLRIGVMLGHGSKSTWAGRLWHSSGSAVTMDSEKMTVKQIQAHLSAALTTGPSEDASDGGEELLYSFTQGITAKLAENRKKGLFREDAALAVVFITDENDICYPGQVKDPEKKESSAYDRDCKGKNINAQSVLAQVKALQGDRPYLLSAIVYADTKTMPKSGENELGLGIIDLVKLSNGKLIDMGLGHCDEGLAEIGKVTAARLRLKTSFKLSRTGIHAATIKATVDGKDVPFTYQAELGEVQIQDEDAGKYGSVIVVSYCLLAPEGGSSSSASSSSSSSSGSSSSSSSSSSSGSSSSSSSGTSGTDGGSPIGF